MIKINRINDIDLGKSKYQRWVFFLFTFILFFLNLISNSDTPSIYNSFMFDQENIITNSFYSLVYVVCLYFSILKVFIPVIESNDFIKYSIGRKSIIISVIVISIHIIFDFFDKSVSSVQLFYNSIVFSALFFSSILSIREFYRYKKGEIVKIDREKVSKNYNWNVERIKNRSFSYRNETITNNGLNPSMTIFIVQLIAIGVLSIFKLKMSFYFILSLLLLTLIIKNSFSRLITMIVLSFVFAIGSFSINHYLYNDSKNPFMHNQGDTNDLTYSKTRIGSTNEDLYGIFNLLFRVDWPNKNSDLLPDAVYNYYNYNDSSWNLSAELRGSKKLDVEKNTTVKVLKNQPVINNSFIDRNKGYHSSSLVYNKESQSYINLPLNKNGSGNITIYGNINNTNGTSSLPMPYNTDYMVGDNMSKNNFLEYIIGTMSISGYSGYKNWTFYYDNYNDDQQVMTDPVSEDLIYPKKLENNLAKLITEANIKESDNRELKVQKLIRYFKENYTYTLDTRYKNSNRGRTMNEFLSTDKRGHCEYFATALTLALRELGIPSRYSTGYMVDEKKESEGKNIYWIRAKDAHAWSLYWNGKAWQTADATPYSSNAFDKYGSDSYIGDKIDSLRFKINNLNIDMGEIAYYTIGFALSVFLIVFFVIKIKKKDRPIFYKDKEVNNFEKKMKKYERKHKRYDNETYLSWAKRIGNPDLIETVNDYYKSRYAN